MKMILAMMILMNINDEGCDGNDSDVGYDDDDD